MSTKRNKLKRLLAATVARAFRLIGGPERRVKAALWLLHAIEDSLPLGYQWRLRGHIIDQSSTLGLQPSHVQARIYGFFDIVQRVAAIPGEIVECGVGYGGSLASLVYAVALHELDKTVYGFDSFAGFPAASAEDTGPRAQAGHIPSGWTDTDYELIQAIFAADRAENAKSLLKVPDVNVVLVPGFFEDTLVDNLPDQIAFLHVDTDLYESSRHVLQAALPRMSPGGIVIFDEYKDERWPGATQAVEEMSAAYGLDVQYFPHQRRYGIEIPALGDS